MKNSSPIQSKSLRRAFLTFVLAISSAAAFLVFPALASAQPSYLGFQVHALWYERSSAEMDRELNMIQDLGGNTVRVDVGWSSLETDAKGSRTGWYLEKLDRFVAGASQRGIKVIATLVTTPCWASSAPESLKQGCKGEWWNRGVQNYPPNNPQDFADAARFITSRYGTKLAALEIWNEPNTERFLVAPNRATAYAALVKAAYPAAKAGNASVPVIVGALASADRPFLDELYARGIKGSFDGISVHPYNEWRDPYDRWQAQWKQYTFLPGIEWIREGQLAAGDSSPLWITEFGWDTCTGGSWCVNEAQQADYTVKGFQILNTLNYVAGATDYELRDESTDKSEFEGNWGLVHEDFSPKPIYEAVKAQLHGSAPAPSVSLEIEVSNPGTVIAEGQGSSQRQRLEVQFKGCPKRTPAARLIMTSKTGSYHRKLGSVEMLKGCKVTVKPQSSSQSVTKKVPGLASMALSSAVAVPAA